MCFQLEFNDLRRKGYQGEGACQSMPQCAYHNLCLYSMDVSIVQRPFESSRKAGCPQVVCSLSQSLQLNMRALAHMNILAARCLVRLPPPTRIMAWHGMLYGMVYSMVYSMLYGMVYVCLHLRVQAAMACRLLPELWHGMACSMAW